MGRKPWSSRLTVEKCLTLDTQDFSRAGVFGLKSGAYGTFSWRSPVGRNTPPARFWLLGDSASTRALKFDFGVLLGPSEPLSALYLGACWTVPVVATSCHFGGQRWWFLCPIPRGNVACRARVKKLYLPPGATALGCRKCWNLTYRSAKRHDRSIDPLLRLSLEALCRRMSHGNLKSRLRAVRATTILLNRGLIR